MDIVGTVLFMGAICCLVLALQWGGQIMPWRSANVIGLLVGFGMLTLLFGFVQRKRGEDALIPLRVLRQRSILVGSIFLFFTGMLNYVVCCSGLVRLHVPSLLTQHHSIHISYPSIFRRHRMCPQ